jgi:hypothetical protein
LTDPFADDDALNIGFGVEVAFATTDELPTDLRHSWLMELTQGVSHKAAEDGRFHLRHAKFGVFLFSVRIESETYRDWVDDNSTMGFLVGVPVPGVSNQIALPSGTAVFLMSKLLTPAEFHFVAAQGLDGARELVQRFERDGTYHLSLLTRASVV